jgi:hypothetical protein
MASLKPGFFLSSRRSRNQLANARRISDPELPHQTFVILNRSAEKSGLLSTDHALAITELRELTFPAGDVLN